MTFEGGVAGKTVEHKIAKETESPTNPKAPKRLRESAKNGQSCPPRPAGSDMKRLEIAWLRVDRLKVLASLICAFSKVFSAYLLAEFV